MKIQETRLRFLQKNSAADCGENRIGFPEKFRRKNMKKYVCEVCGWEYDEEIGDPENGIEAGTKFEDLPEEFVCPLCGVGKEDFAEA